MNYNNESARVIIALLFDGYKKRKKDKELYKHGNGVPEVIIETYYAYVKKPSFANLLDNFKKRYLYNENKMEGVHTKEERNGLSSAYDYINKKTECEDISIYDLSYIHEELYSKTKYPEFGGRYRNEDVYLLDSQGNKCGNVELCPYWNITHEMNLLNPELKELIQRGIRLGKETNPSEILKYIDDCILLKCKLIKIHPFKDGNGRAVRIFVNLLFKLANIPPVYIENKEKHKYQEAMNNALANNEYSDILDFYHYKICDSIMALDVDVKEKMVYKDEDVPVIEDNKRL